MTSLGAALGIGVTGLTSNQFALATTANNIANVNTEGYVRKVTNFESKVLVPCAPRSSVMNSNAV